MKPKVSINQVEHEDDSLEKNSTSKTDNEVSKFSAYISRLKMQVNPNLKFSKSSILILESFILDFFERIVKESCQIMSISGRKTITPRDIRAAISLIIPGELGKHAKLEAEKAINTNLPSN